MWWEDKTHGQRTVRRSWMGWGNTSTIRATYFVVGIQDLFLREESRPRQFMGVDRTFNMILRIIIAACKGKHEGIKVTPRTNYFPSCHFIK